MSCTFWIRRKRAAAKLKEEAATIAKKQEAVTEPLEKAVVENDKPTGRKSRAKSSE